MKTDSLGFEVEDNGFEVDELGFEVERKKPSPLSVAQDTIASAAKTALSAFDPLVSASSKTLNAIPEAAAAAQKEVGGMFPATGSVAGGAQDVALGRPARGMSEVFQAPVQQQTALQDVASRAFLGQNREPAPATIYSNAVLSGTHQTQAVLGNVPRMVARPVLGEKNPVTMALTDFVGRNEENAKRFHELRQSKDPIKNFVGDSIEAMPLVVSSIIMGGGTGNLIKGYAELSRMIPFGAGAAGGYAREAENKGAPYWKQVAYGVAGGMVEMATESPVFEGFLNAFEMVAKNKAVRSGAKTFLQKYGEAGLEWLKNVGREFVQEATVDPVMGVTEKAVFNPAMPWTGEGGAIDPKAILKAGYGGAGMGVLMAALGLPASMMSRRMVEDAVENNTPIDMEALRKQYSTDLMVVEQYKQGKSKEILNFEQMAGENAPWMPQPQPALPTGPNQVPQLGMPQPFKTGKGTVIPIGTPPTQDVITPTEPETEQLKRVPRPASQPTVTMENGKLSIDLSGQIKEHIDKALEERGIIPKTEETPEEPARKTEEQELFEVEQQGLKDRYERYKQEAGIARFPVSQHHKYAIERLADEAKRGIRGEPATAEGTRQTELSTDGVESFGKGREGEQDMFDRSGVVEIPQPKKLPLARYQKDIDWIKGIFERGLKDVTGAHHYGLEGADRGVALAAIKNYEAGRPLTPKQESELRQDIALKREYDLQAALQQRDEKRKPKVDDLGFEVEEATSQKANIEDEIDRKYSQLNASPEDGSWERSASSNYARRIMAPVYKEIEKKPWKQTDGYIWTFPQRARSNKQAAKRTVTEAIQKLNKLDMLAQAYDRNGEVYYAKKGTPVPEGMLSAKELPENWKTPEQFDDVITKKTANDDFYVQGEARFRTKEQEDRIKSKKERVQEYKEKGESPYRYLYPNVRGGWTIDKIKRELKRNSSLNSPEGVTWKNEISLFDSPEELKENLYFHGTGTFVDKLKAGVALPESYFRGGGYGEKYYTISLSKSKNTASLFSGHNSYGNVHTVLLRKGAKVVSMPEIQDSSELEEKLVDLWNKGIDAVKIGDWNDQYSEKELAVLNPKAIVLGKSESFQVYNKKKFEPYTDEYVAKIYKNAIEDKEALYRQGESSFNPNIKRSAWSDKNGAAKQHSTIAKLKLHPQYKNAKAGDIDAAFQVVADTLKIDKLSDIPEGSIIAPVCAIEATGENKIPIAMAHAIADIISGQVDQNINQINKVFHTGADSASRIERQAEFDGEVISGANYVIVDDVVTMGGTIANLKGYIESNGGRVIGVHVIGAAQFSTKLKPSIDTLNKINYTYGKGLQNELQRTFGINTTAEQLTEAEARFFLHNARRTRETFRPAQAGRRSLPEVQTPLSQEVKPTAFSKESQSTRKGFFNSPRLSAEAFFNAAEKAQIRAINRRLFGDDKVDFVDRIQENKKALGKYTDAVITILDGEADMTDTFYHEAVHKYLDVFATNEERMAIYSAVKNKFRDMKALDVEEKVAEEFIKYAKSRSGFIGKVKLAFDRIIHRIKAFLKNADAIQKVYTDILSKEAVNRKARTPQEAQAAYRDFTRTPEFQKWFGSSKIVDKNGDPLPVYHGTDKAFTSFEKGKSEARDKGWFGNGYYFTAEEAAASAYASGFEDEALDSANVLPVFLSIKNPFKIDISRMIHDDQVNFTNDYGGPEAFTKWLIESGYDGVVASVSDKYLPDERGQFYEVMAINPTQIKSVTGNTGTYDPANPDIRYRTAAANPITVADAKQAMAGNWVSAREKIEDDWVRVKKLVQEAGTKDGVVSEETDMYSAEVRYWGRVGARTEKANDELKSIVEETTKTAKKHNIDSDTFTEIIDAYLVALHAPERNAQHGENAAGMTDKEAETVIENIKKKPYYKDVLAIADRVKALNDQTLDILLDGKVITQEYYDNLRNMYPNHVPLQRVFDDKEDFEQVLTSRGYGVQGTGLKRAKGSDRKVADVLTNISANLASAIVRAEKNIVDNHTWKFAKEHDGMDGLFQEVELPIVPVGTTEHRAAYDPVFMNQLAKFAKSLGAQFKTGGQPGRVLGYFHHAGDVIERKFGTPREVQAHETGHFIDKKYKLKERFYKRGETKAVAEEMLKHMERRGESENRMKQTAERFADSFEWWLVNRQLAKRDMPLFSAKMEMIISEIPDLRPLLKMEPQPGFSVEKMNEVVFARQKFTDDPSILQLRVNGEQKYLKINDAGLAAALKGTNKAQVDGLVRAVGAFTRLMSSLHTRFNPEFAAPNMIRDIEEMTVYLAAKKEFGVKGAGKTIKRHAESMKDIVDSIRGKDTPGTRLYDQMKMDGGTTGGLGLSTREQLEINIDKIRATSKSSPRKAAQALLQAVDNWNTIFENAQRLDVYKQALAQGMSRNRAARLAKEATINFNKKGTWGPVVNSLYMFSNASIQGSAKMLRSMRDPKTAAIVISTIGAAILLVNQYNDGIDDDWRDKISKWDRLNGLCILLPSKDGIRYVTIPVSWGLKPIKVGLEYVYDFVDGKEKDVPKAVAAIFASIWEGYNPLGGTDIVQAIMPTIVDMPMELARNQSWSGSKIRPDWAPNAPDSIKYFKRLKDKAAGAFFINVTKEMGEKGIEVSPADVNYVYEQLVGGAGRFVSKVASTAKGMTEGDVKAKETPFLSRFYRDIADDEIRKKDVDYKDLQKQLDDQDKSRFYAKEAAGDVYERIKDMPKSEIRKELRVIAQDRPELVKKVLELYKQDKLGLEYNEKLIKKLGVENGERAKYLYTKYQGMATTEEKKAFLRNARAKGILTDTVMKQFKRLVARNEI